MPSASEDDPTMGGYSAQTPLQGNTDLMHLSVIHGGSLSGLICEASQGLFPGHFAYPPMFQQPNIPSMECDDPHSDNLTYRPDEARTFILQFQEIPGAV